MHLSAIELCQTNALILLHLLEQETAQQLDGVGTHLVDVVTRVATHQALQLSTQEEAASGSLFLLETERGGSITSTGTRHEDFSLVLGIQVDEVVARHEAGLHTLGTRQSRLFIACKDALDGTVLDVAAFQQCQFHSTSYTVVGTQRGTLGSQPLTVNIGLDGVGIEIELHIDELVTHHIHVALQDDGLAVFHTFGGRLANDDVAGFIDFRVQAAALAPLFQISNHLLFTLRRAWNFVNLRKLLEDNSRF